MPAAAGDEGADAAAAVADGRRRPRRRPAGAPWSRRRWRQSEPARRPGRPRAVHLAPGTRRPRDPQRAAAVHRLRRAAPGGHRGRSRGSTGSLAWRLRPHRPVAGLCAAALMANPAPRSASELLRVGDTLRLLVVSIVAAQAQHRSGGPRRGRRCRGRLHPCLTWPEGGREGRESGRGRDAAAEEAAPPAKRPGPADAAGQEATSRRTPPLRRGRRR